MRSNNVYACDSYIIWILCIDFKYQHRHRPFQWNTKKEKKPQDKMSFIGLLEQQIHDYTWPQFMWLWPDNEKDDENYIQLIHH